MGRGRFAARGASPVPGDDESFHGIRSRRRDSRYRPGSEQPSLGGEDDLAKRNPDANGATARVRGNALSPGRGSDGEARDAVQEQGQRVGRFDQLPTRAPVVRGPWMVFAIHHHYHLRRGQLPHTARCAAVRGHLFRRRYARFAGGRRRVKPSRVGDVARGAGGRSCAGKLVGQLVRTAARRMRLRAVHVPLEHDPERGVASHCTHGCRPHLRGGCQHGLPKPAPPAVHHCGRHISANVEFGSIRPRCRVRSQGQRAAPGLS
mmetsp:Transcript_104417/g.300911  ORF Transcript_104417/g.300911 Transcript_104417/m.300911 type:complete len:262 (+) Transcript_104417:146-931(+)